MTTFKTPHIPTLEAKNELDVDALQGNENYRYDPYQETLPRGISTFLSLLTRVSEESQLPFVDEPEESFLYQGLAVGAAAEISITLFTKLLSGNLAAQAVHLGRYVWAHLDDRGAPMCVFWATSRGYYARRIEIGSRLESDIWILSELVYDQRRHR